MAEFHIILIWGIERFTLSQKLDTSLRNTVYMKSFQLHLRLTHIVALSDKEQKDAYCNLQQQHKYIYFDEHRDSPN